MPYNGIVKPVTAIVIPSPLFPAAVAISSQNIIINNQIIHEKIRLGMIVILIKPNDPIFRSR